MVFMFLAHCLSAQLNLQCVGIKNVQSADNWRIPIALEGSVPFLHLWPSEKCRGCLSQAFWEQIEAKCESPWRHNSGGHNFSHIIYDCILFMLFKLHIMENLLIIQSSVGCTEGNADKTDDKCTDNQIVGTCFLTFPLYKRIMFRTVWNYQFSLSMHSLENLDFAIIWNFNPIHDIFISKEIKHWVYFLL